MSANPLSKIGPLLAASILVLASAGCSSNPPCETDLAVVDQARSSAKVAEDKLDTAQQEQAQLQQQLDAEKARQAELEQKKAQLLDRLAELDN